MTECATETAPRPQSDRLCYRNNCIPPLSLNNSHRQLNLGPHQAQDVGLGGMAVRFGRLSMTEKQAGRPEVTGPSGWYLLLPDAVARVSAKPAGNQERARNMD